MVKLFKRSVSFYSIQKFQKRNRVPFYEVSISLAATYNQAPLLNRLKKRNAPPINAPVKIINHPCSPINGLPQVESGYIPMKHSESHPSHSLIHFQNQLRSRKQRMKKRGEDIPSHKIPLKSKS